MNGLIILAILFFSIVLGGAMIFEIFAYRGEQTAKKYFNF